MLTLAAGCSCPDVAAVRVDVAAGRFDQAHTRLDELTGCDPDDRHLYALERASVAFHEGDAAGAVAALASAKRRVVDLNPYDPPTWSSVDWWLERTDTILRDETVADYPGRDYEQLLMYAQLSLGELLTRGGDAIAFDQQRLERQLEIQAEIAQEAGVVEAGFERFRGIAGDNPKASYRLVGFGDFLRGMMLEEHPTRLSAANDAYERAFELAPEYPFVASDRARLSGEVRQAPGTGTLWIITMTGRGPWLEERQMVAPQVIIEAVRQVWNISQDRLAFPNITGIRVPELRTHADNPAAVAVEVDGQPVGTTGTITDVEAVARAEFDAMEDTVIARAVLRRAVKTLAVEAIKHSRAKHHERRVDDAKTKKERRREEEKAFERMIVEGIALDLALLGWTFIEDADLRSWSLLPARFQVLRVELPPGVHEVTLRAVDGAGAVTGAPQRVAVTVGPTWNSYVLGVVPTLAGGPAPITSDPADAPPASP